MFKETVAAYTFDIGGLFAGFVVAAQLGIFQLSPWALPLYPAIVSAKGVIGGLLSGRLGTALHLGTIYPKFLGNTKSFYKLFEALIVTTLTASITMSTVALLFGYVFWGITFADLADVIAVVIATMSTGLLISLITIKVAFVSFKKGLDPDVIVYPVMSTIADILITVFYVAILNLFFFIDFGKLAIIAIGLVNAFLVLFILPKNRHEPEFTKTLKESLATLIVVAFIVNVTGTLLKGISEHVESRKEIYTVYPALIDMIGDVGSVVGSTATTKLALGILAPSLSSIRKHAKHILSALSASITIIFFLSLLSLSINSLLSISAFLDLLVTLLIANLISVAAIVLLSFGISILTFKKGLDPDNFVIPIESSLADSTTTLALLVALLMLK
ncbi:MAG: magnesium transporter [Candidatus Bathyarchaeia archaeon]